MIARINILASGPRACMEHVRFNLRLKLLGREKLNVGDVRVSIDPTSSDET